MDALFASGRIVDGIVALVIVEAAAFAVLSFRTMRGPDLSDLLWNLAAGLCLLLALRAALTGAPWFWIAAMLAAAGIAHCVDQARRWRA